MTEAQTATARAGGFTAAQIGALCTYLGMALAADPDTALIADAVEGLGAMADRLSVALFDLAEAA